MRTYWSLIKKETIESLRTYKLIILFIVFLFFGMLSPVTAKYTPDILKASGLNPEAMGISSPTMIDSWMQFFKNIGQIGLIVLVIIFCGIMANEFSKGTLINLLTKGLKRSTVIISKFTVATIIWTVAYGFCIAVCYLYSIYFFTNTGLYNVFLSFFSLWLYGVFLISLLILGGVVFKNVFGSLMITGGFVIIASIINIIPSVKKYIPASLAGDNLPLLLNQLGASDIIPAVIVCAVLIIGVLMLSISIFNKKQI